MKCFSSKHNKGPNLSPPDLYECFVDNFWFKTINLTSLLNWDEKDPDRPRKDLEVSNHGLKQIKQMIAEYGVDCDFEESGMLEVALNEKQIRLLDKYAEELPAFGLESTFIQGKELESEIKWMMENFDYSPIHL